MFFSCNRYTKPQTFADCVGDELPLGWEESYDQIIGQYYINHFDREYFILGKLSNSNPYLDMESRETVSN